MRWAGHAARKGQTRNTQTILVGKPQKDLDVDGRIILEWMSKTRGVRI
jgi:hypothetical protein